MTDPVIGLVMVAMFALVNGVNDGGTIMAVGLRTTTKRPWVRLGVFIVIFALAPAVVGSRVAVTLAEQLVVFEGDAGQIAMISAVLGTLAVVWVFSSRGLPTSLTLGLVGAITGAGVASGLPVGWAVLGFVLIVAAVAPVLGMLGAVVLHRVAIRLLGTAPSLRRLLPLFGHVLQALAYGANDGQKMLAVLAIVAGTSATVSGVPLSAWALTVAVFTIGTVIGIARIGPTIDSKILPLRSESVALAQLSAAGAVLGSAAVAGPVSLIQSLSGGLVGVGISVTPWRVRWAAVGQILIAWVVTLPASFVVGGLLAAGLGALS